MYVDVTIGLELGLVYDCVCLDDDEGKVGMKSRMREIEEQT